MPGAGSSDTPPLARISARTHRLIASRHPTVGVFDAVANRDQAIAAMFLEQLTNPRNTRAAERLARLPEQDLVLGQPGATQIMAAFIHTAEEGGRFHREELGAWYAAFRVETAIRETVYHNTRRLRASEMEISGTVLQLRELITHVKAEFHDIRALGMDSPLYDKDSYSASQDFAHSLRQAGSNGIAYNCVRQAGGENIAVFRPRLLPPVDQGDHYQYEWMKDPEPVIRKLTNPVSLIA